MKFAEINKKFTEAVAEYIMNGWTINAGTMCGHQTNEISKVDVTNGKEIVRILIENFHTKEIEGVRGYWSGISLIVGKVTDNCKINSQDTWSTPWNNHLEIISKEDFYQIGDRRDSEWYGTFAEAREAKIKYINRMQNNRDYEEIILDNSAKKIVLSFLKRQPKCKTVKVSDIDSVRKVVRYTIDGKIEVTYRVFAKGNTYYLH